MKKKTKILSLLALTAIGSAFICSSCKNQANDEDNNSSESILETQDETETITTSKGEKENPLNVAEALEKATLNDETTRYYVRARIKEIKNAEYGQMVLEDESGTIDVYGTYGEDGVKRYSELTDKPEVGDTVLLYATIVTFKNSPEIKSGWIISYEKGTNEFDSSKYEAVSITNARNKADGALVKVTGVVAKFTYASGMKKNGFYLVDDTNSIYVYDANGTITSNVKEGNKITLYAKKTYYILEKEKTAASKYGYKGCNQLTDCVLESNDNNVNTVNYSWAKESTVKDVMNTSVSNDISTTIFKVNALIRKSQGDGFVNYYIDDLDETTGSYVYTQANGEDLSYLEEFDGKICTVYLSCINAKSSDSGCVWRFIPVEVKNENYKFDLNKTNEFVMNYYALDQFKSRYEGDPQTELVTSVSSSLLGFSNVNITYESSNTDVLSIEEENSKMILHTKAYGKATVTIKVSYNGSTLTKTVDINYSEPVKYDTINISEVYSKDIDTTVCVKGIVSAGVTNQKAFYLIDETGMIAVRCDDETLKTLKVGDEVVVNGKYVNYSGTKTGQLHIEDASVLVNYGGNNSYSTNSFVNSTITELNTICSNKDESSTSKVYVIEASVVEEKNEKYSNIYLVDKDGIKFMLYTSNSSQYSWLLEYSGTLKFEVTINAWNGKFKGSVISVILEDGTKVNTIANLSE